MRLNLVDVECLTCSQKHVTVYVALQFKTLSILRGVCASVTSLQFSLQFLFLFELCCIPLCSWAFCDGLTLNWSMFVS